MLNVHIPRYMIDFLDMNSGPIVAMVWEGKDVVKTGRSILPYFNPNI